MDRGHLSPDVNQASTTRIVVLTPQLQYTDPASHSYVDTHYYYTERGSFNGAPGDIGQNWHGLQLGWSSLWAKVA